jgi:hypothetical protein
VRGILEEYITYLWNNYREDLVGIIHGISIHEIQQVWKSDEFLWLLYTGYESNCTTTRQHVDEWVINGNVHLPFKHSERHVNFESLVASAA